MGRKGPQTEEGRERIRRSKLGDKNPQWVGDKIRYHGLHNWVRSHFPKPEFCADCRVKPPYDLANKGIYDRNLDNWEYLCRRCHMIKDGRLEKFHSRENYEKISKSLMGHPKFYKGDKRW